MCIQPLVRFRFVVDDSLRYHSLFVRQMCHTRSFIRLCIHFVFAAALDFSVTSIAIDQYAPGGCFSIIGTTEAYVNTGTTVSTCSTNYKCVCAVRFSPNGECVATGGDDGYVIVWYRTTKPLDSSVLPAKSWNEVTSARQLQRVILRGKLSEICDLSWTKDSKYIITGSVDGTVGVWDVCASKIFHQMKDHKGFVQGVACDPRGEYFSSQCAHFATSLHAIFRSAIFFWKQDLVPLDNLSSAAFSIT